MNDIEKSGEDFCRSVADLLEQARAHVRTTVNVAMVYTYYEIGRKIVEEEQNGEDRAEYGKRILENLSAYLTERFGRGFSVDNLRLIRKFYRVYSKAPIQETVFPESSNLPETSKERAFSLSWSHYLKLMRITNDDERRFYEIEAVKNKWSLSELKRQYDSSLYERLALSRDKAGIKQLAEKGQIIEKPEDAIKDPFVIEFLGLEEKASYSERDLETRIIDNLEKFLLELGTGFTFVGRQVRLTFEEDHYWVDLVFFNRLLSCFVLVDLKIGELKHQDLGQMQMYVNYYDRYVKLESENPTVGIVLCKDKKSTVVELTLPQDNTQIFASRYQTVLPSKEALRKLLTESEES